MSIEIRNYDASIGIGKKSLTASFDVIFRHWGFMVRDCKLFTKEVPGKENNRWIVMPQKSIKKNDGTWDTPIPYFEFINKEMLYKLQAEVLKEIDKLPQQPTQSQQPLEYYPNGTKISQPIHQEKPETVDQLDLPF